MTVRAPALIGLCCGFFLGGRAALGADPAAAPGSVRALTGLTIVTGKGETIEGATCVIAGGTFQAIGKDAPIPPAALVTNEPGKVMIPGLVAAETLLAAGPRDDERSIFPEAVAFDGFDYLDLYRRQLEGGTTCAYLSPSMARLVPGQGSVARLRARPGSSLLVRSAALEAVLTADALSPPGIFSPPPYPDISQPFPRLEDQLPGTRASQVAELRKFLAGQGPIIARARSKELPVRVRANEAREIDAALSLAEEFGLRLTIVGGREAGKRAAAIKARGASVVWLCPFSPESIDLRDPSPDAVRLDLGFDTPRLLAEAGVPVAIATEAEDGIDLLGAASFAVAHGFPREQALAAITLGAAQLLGVESAAGTIEPGRSADFVLLSGAPFAEGTAVLKTFVGGECVFEGAAAGRAEQSGDLVLRRALVLTGDGGRFPETDILIEKGKIAAVGANLKAPAGAQERDLGGRVIVPGMIDLATSLGTHNVQSEEGTVPPFEGGATLDLSLSATIRPGDPVFRACVEAGVLGVLVRGRGGSLVSGTGTFLLPGADRADFAAVPFASLDLDVSGSDRDARVEALRSLMRRLRDYEATRRAYKDALEEYRHRKPRDRENKLKEPAPPPDDPLLERLLEARKRTLPVIVRAERGDEISEALKLLADEGGLEGVIAGASGIVHAEEVTRMARGVILTPPYREFVEGAWVDLPRYCAEHDIPFALATGGAQGTLSLRFYAADAVRRGLSADRALRAVTSVPARLLGLSDRFGVIAAGRVASILVLDGEPFAPGTRVLEAFVKGKVVHQRDK